MLSKFIIISASLFYILIYCLSKTIYSVRFIPYNFSLNRSVKTLKNSQSISRNSIFYIILLNVDSVESFIMTLYFLSDIYYVNLPTIATSKMIFLVSINCQNLGNRVILIAYSGNLVSHFFYFWLSATAARAISYWTFFLIITCLMFTLLQSTWLWLMFIDTFIITDDMINIMNFTSHVIRMHRILSIIVIHSLFSLLHLITHWILSLKIVLSNDVEKHPGDFVNNFFTFCNWNLNSLAKDNFYRTQLLDAHNSFHNYDIISVCETSLNDTVQIPEKMLESYTFLACNNPKNVKHGGVGLFYKDSFAIKIRDDIAFDETLVIEISKLLPDSSEQGLDFTNHSSRIQKRKYDETRKTLKKEKTISNVEKHQVVTLVKSLVFHKLLSPKILSLRRRRRKRSLVLILIT